MAEGDVYKLDLFQRYAGQRIMNSYHFARKTPGAPTQAECAALALAWKEHLRNHQAGGLTHESWTCQQVSGAGVTWSPVTCSRDGGLRFEGLHTGTLTGGNSGEAMPPQSALVVTLSSGMSGRSRRGRTYIGGFVEAFQNEGTVTPGIVTAQQTNWDTILAIYSGAGTSPLWYLGVFSVTIASGCKPAAAHPHALENLATPNPSGAFFPVIATKVRNIVYTQRRRTIGVGN